MEILITPHFVEKGIKYGLEGVNAAGKTIPGTNATSPVFPFAQQANTNLGGTFRVDDENFMASIDLKATHQGNDSVVLEAKARFIRVPTAEELEAMLLAWMGKRGRVKADFMKIEPLDLGLSKRNAPRSQDLGRTEPTAAEGLLQPDRRGLSLRGPAKPLYPQQLRPRRDLWK